MSAPTDLADRYGAPAPRRRAALIVSCAVVVAAFLGWLGWTIWDQSTPEVQSRLISYDVVDEHAATARLDVDLSADDARASCTLRAYADDHAVVGELVFTPREGRNDEQVRTERRATSVELLGCTTPGQKRPR